MEEKETVGKGRGVDFTLLHGVVVTKNIVQLS